MSSVSTIIFCLSTICCICPAALVPSVQALLQYTISSSAAAKAAAAAATQGDGAAQQQQQQQDAGAAALLQQLHTGDGFDAEQVCFGGGGVSW